MRQLRVGIKLSTETAAHTADMKVFYGRKKIYFFILVAFMKYFKKFSEGVFY